MTCIAAIGDGEKVWLGGDAAAVSGYSVHTRAEPKVFIKNKVVFGFTSSFRMGQLLQYRLEVPIHTNTQSVEDYLHIYLLDEIRKTLKDGGYASVSNNREEIGTFIIGYLGHIYHVDSDFQIGRPDKNYHAVGAGLDLALGSLYTTDILHSKLTPEQRINIALSAAAEFSSVVRPPFTVVTV